MITLTEAAERYAAIRLVACDPEVAHGMEDELRREVLQAIADGAPCPGALAIVALASESIEFRRWCA